MIRPDKEFEDVNYMLSLACLLDTEELEALIAESEKNLLPCPCCGRKNPKISYGYDRNIPDQKHNFSIECPGNPMHTTPHNPNYDGCGNQSGDLWAIEDEDLVDFKEAIRYITEAWNRRS